MSTDFSDWPGPRSSPFAIAGRAPGLSPAAAERAHADVAFSTNVNTYDRT